VLPASLLLAPLWQNKGRLAVAVLAIALGVALGYAVQLINQSALGEFAQALQTLSGDADLTVRGPRAGFDESLYPSIAQLPEVAVASPMLEIEASIRGQEQALRIAGVDVFRAGQIQPALLAEVDDFLDSLRADALFLSPAASQWLGAQIGDTVVVQVGLRDVPLRVAGMLRADGSGQRLAAMDIAAAQWLLERQGRLTRIDIKLRPGADLAAVQARIQALLPAGLVAERPEASVQSAARLTRAYRMNLNVLALVALFTGGLLVFSTQALSVVRRRTQLALLRVLGVTRRGVVALLLAEGALLGVAGAAAGVALGFLLAYLGLRFVGADLGAGYFRGITATPRVEPLALAVFFALGVAVAMLGSLIPALEAARTQPGRALKAGDEAHAFERLGSPWPGSAIMAIGAGVVFVPPVAGLPLFGYVAIALLLIGAILLMPRLMTSLLRALPVPRAPAPALAHMQLANAPGPASLSLAAIVAAVSLTVSMAIMVASFRQSLDDWLDRVLPADLYLRAGGSGDTAYLSGSDQQRIAGIRGVRRAEFLRSQQVVLDPARPRVTLLARELDPADPQARVPLVGPHLAPRSGAPPPAWVSEMVADVYGFAPGAVIELPLGGSAVRFTVAGVWRDYARQNGSVLIEREVYVRLTGDTNASDAALWLEPGMAPKDVEARVRAALAGGESLEFAQPGEIRELSLGIFDRSFAVTYALEAAAVAIGLFGLSSSMASQVLARRREFGMLRHIGMTRLQIGSMLAAEGALTSAVGLIVGCALGWFIGLILIHVVNRQSFHWSMDLLMPWLPIAAFSAVLLLLATLAAIVSGRQAMGGDAVRAVKEDW
jgi:putative ABC transport system permease protein